MYGTFSILFGSVGEQGAYSVVQRVKNHALGVPKFPGFVQVSFKLPPTIVADGGMSKDPAAVTVPE